MQQLGRHCDTKRTDERSESCESVCLALGATVTAAIQDNLARRVMDCFVTNVPRNDGVKRVAFTLAEVLITLGIIGVVAAMTIPSLMQKNYERKTVSQLLETQSILSQAIRSAEEEFGDIAGWITEDESSKALIIGNNLKQFLKLAVDCGTFDEAGRCFPNGFYSRLDGEPNPANYAKNSYRYKFILLNGSSVAVMTDDAVTWLQINIDTNGPSKPNMIGKDLFLFKYSIEDKSLIPMGAPGTLYTMAETCKKDAEDHPGFGCAYWVLQYRNMDYLRKK